MNILKFVEIFPTEESCRIHFREVREIECVTCKKCNSKEHWWLGCKQQWKCKSCSFRTTLRSGTMMQSSKLPLRTWYLAMAFMSFSKKGLSANELSRQLDNKRYGTVWKLMHKIRSGMGKRDAKYKLDGMLEFDEGYFVTETTKLEHATTKAGRGSNRVQNVAILAKSTPLENIDKGKKSKCRSC
ncbi:MAG: transposase-like protein [Bacteroidia bacterium]|jgi:transposase-like protein